jgi:hypothetical protein
VAAADSPIPLNRVEEGRESGAKRSLDEIEILPGLSRYVVGVELVWQGPSVALQITRGPEGLSNFCWSVDMVERTESARWRQQTILIRGSLVGPGDRIP